jgi:hypothetical protein
MSVVPILLSCSCYKFLSQILFKKLFPLKLYYVLTIIFLLIHLFFFCELKNHCDFFYEYNPVCLRSFCNLSYSVQQSSICSTKLFYCPTVKFKCRRAKPITIMSERTLSEH